MYLSTTNPSMANRRTAMPPPRPQRWPAGMGEVLYATPDPPIPLTAARSNRPGRGYVISHAPIEPPGPAQRDPRWDELGPVGICVMPSDPCVPEQKILREGYECRRAPCGGAGWVKVVQQVGSTISDATQVINQNAASAESLLNKLQDVPIWQWALAAVVGYAVLQD